MKKSVTFFVFCSLVMSTTGAGAVDAFVAKNLNFRVGPSTQHALLGLIPAGQLVFVQACKGNWCHIRYDARMGWVSSHYLSFKDGNDLYRIYTTLLVTNENVYRTITTPNSCIRYHDKCPVRHHHDVKK